MHVLWHAPLLEWGPGRGGARRVSGRIWAVVRVPGCAHLDIWACIWARARRVIRLWTSAPPSGPRALPRALVGTWNGAQGKGRRPALRPLVLLTACIYNTDTRSSPKASCSHRVPLISSIASSWPSVTGCTLRRGWRNSTMPSSSGYFLRASLRLVSGTGARKELQPAHSSNIMRVAM